VFSAAETEFKETLCLCAFVPVNNETFEERPILVKYKEGDNFNHRNTLSISRIARKLHFVPKFEPDAVIGQKGALCKGLAT